MVKPLMCRGYRSGAEGIRTPDLRRAKAARYFAGAFWRLQNSCKSRFSCEEVLLKLSGHLLGLLHGCCTYDARAISAVCLTTAMTSPGSRSAQISLHTHGDLGSRCCNPERWLTADQGPRLSHWPHKRVPRLVPQGSLLVALLGDQRAAPDALPVYEDLDRA